VLSGILDSIRAAGGRRVLVVDDDAAVRDLLRDALRVEGYAVATAPDAGTALDLLWAEWERQPAVILLDLLLPAVDGMTFTELYRELPVRHAPVVLMSGLPAAEAVASEAGVEAVLRKPFDLDLLLATVARHARPEA
jgi:CheY-like chemotaxis protein